DGKGSVKVRAKIKTRDESTVLIKEIPPTTTTDSLIASIEDATQKGKLKVKSINDFTSEDVEIEIKCPSGVDPEKLVDALYAFTDCEVTIASRIVVIKDNRPVELTVSEVLLEKYSQQYPRLTTKSSRHDEIDVKEVAFKAFKVAYDRESGYVGYKVNGEEFKTECTKFDKVLLVFKDGTYKVSELPEKLFVGPELFYCGLPEREKVFTCAYTDRNASYLKRFTFGGTILNKAYSCIPEKS